MKGIKTTVDSTKSSVDSINKKMETISEDQVKLKSDVAFLVEENYNLKNQLNQLEQYQKKSNLIINGIPENENETLNEKIKNLAKKIDVNLKEFDIIAAHRLHAKRSPAPVIVRLLNLEKKTKMIANSRKLKPNTESLGWDTEPKPIFINEQLTKTNALLLKKAQDLKKNGQIKFVWSRDGNILIREDVNTPSIKILCEEDLIEIDNTIRNKRPASSTSNLNNDNNTEPVAANTRTNAYKKLNLHQSNITKYSNTRK